MISLSGDSCDLVHQKRSGLSERDLRILAAKNLVDLIPAGNDLFLIKLTPDGLTYFEDRRQRRVDFLKEHLATFVTGFASGVLATMATDWLIQALSR